jgi:hypothetical protein
LNRRFDDKKGRPTAAGVVMTANKRMRDNQAEAAALIKIRGPARRRKAQDTEALDAGNPP